MAFSSLQKRAYLRQAWESRTVPETPSESTPDESVSDKLKSMSGACIVPILTGLQIQATSGNGHSTTLRTSLKPEDVADMCEELIMLYEDSSSAIIAARGSASEEDVYNEMMARLRPCRSITINHSSVMAGG